MNKKVVLLVILFAVSFGYSFFCELSGHVTQPDHAAFCALLHPNVYADEVILPIFLLLFTGFLAFVLLTFSPQKFVYTIYWPPQQ